MPVCEGCGTKTDDLHIQRRAQRIELARKFRPAQIRALFLNAAPPSRAEDYFYRAAPVRSSRSLASRMFFDELSRTMGAAPGSEIIEDLALAEFERRGFFLANSIECPLEEVDQPQTAMRRIAPRVIKRVQTEYNPAYIVPLGQSTQELIRLFGLIGWGDRLVLDRGRPFVDPYLGDPQRQSSAGSAFGERIHKLLAALP